MVSFAHRSTRRVITIDSVFPSRLRLARHRMNPRLSQKDLANLVGLSQSAIGMYESGARVPDLEMVQRLAYALNTSISYLVGETDDPTPPPKVAAAHRQGAEPGTPLKPDTQLIIERAVRRAIEEIDALERQSQKEQNSDTESQ